MGNPTKVLPPASFFFIIFFLFFYFFIFYFSLFILSVGCCVPCTGLVALQKCVTFTTTFLLTFPHSQAILGYCFSTVVIDSFPPGKQDRRGRPSLGWPCGG